jgi:hypothetical protein
VVRNGYDKERARATGGAVAVFLPELAGQPSSSSAGQESQLPRDSQRWLVSRHGEEWKEQLAHEHVRALASQQEQRMHTFLEACHRALPQLPSAPRYVFTAWGSRVTDLTGLWPDQELHISCGEPWFPSRAVEAAQRTLELEIAAMRKLRAGLTPTQQLVSVDDRHCLALSAVETSRLEQLVAGAEVGTASVSPCPFFVLSPSRHLLCAGQPSLCLAASALEPGATVELQPLSEADTAAQKWVLDGDRVTSAMSAELGLALVGPTLQLARLAEAAQVCQTATREMRLFRMIGSPHHSL